MTEYLSQCERVFGSKEDVKSYFRSFFGWHANGDGSGMTPLEGKMRQKTDIGFQCRYDGRAHTFLVTLAEHCDIKQLLELEEEFVGDHKELYRGEKQYKDIKHGDWCTHVGLSSDDSVRENIIQNIVRKNQIQAKQSAHLGVNGPQSFLRAGCTLKCEKLLAHNKRHLAGFLHFTLAENTPDLTRSSKRLKRRRGEDTGEYVKVTHLLVSKDYRGRGVGSLLLASMMHRVSLCDPDYVSEVFLTVTKKNEPAVSLYKSLGFEIIGAYEKSLGKDEKKKLEWYQMQMKAKTVYS